MKKLLFIAAIVGGGLYLYSKRSQATESADGGESSDTGSGDGGGYYKPPVVGEDGVTVIDPVVATQGRDNTTITPRTKVTPKVVPSKLTTTTVPASSFLLAPAVAAKKTKASKPLIVIPKSTRGQVLAGLPNVW